MAEENPILELIENYLSGELSEEESKAFEKRLAEDEAFRKEVVMYKKLIGKIQEEGEKQTREILKDIHQKNFESDAEPTRKSYYRVAAAIALLIISGLAYFFFFRKENSGPDEHKIVFQKAVVSEDGSLGFVDGNTKKDSVVVLIEITEHDQAYRFSDTLMLQLHQAYPENEINIRYVSQGNYFLLSMDNVSYKIYRGFDYFQPLQTIP